LDEERYYSDDRRRRSAGLRTCLRLDLKAKMIHVYVNGAVTGSLWAFVEVEDHSVQ